MSRQSLSYFYPPIYQETSSLSKGYPSKYIKRPSQIEPIDCVVKCIEHVNKTKTDNGEQIINTNFITCKLF